MKGFRAFDNLKSCNWFVCVVWIVIKLYRICIQFTVSINMWLVPIFNQNHSISSLTCLGVEQWFWPLNISVSHPHAPPPHPHPHPSCRLPNLKISGSFHAANPLANIPTLTITATHMHNSQLPFSQRWRDGLDLMTCHFSVHLSHWRQWPTQEWEKVATGITKTWIPDTIKTHGACKPNTIWFYSLQDGMWHWPRWPTRTYIILCKFRPTH